MRYPVGLIYACALGVMLMACSETAGTTGGSGGSAGMGGDGGQGGMPECEVASDCSTDNECVAASCVDGMCVFTPAADGTTCDRGNLCTAGACADGTCESTPVNDGAVCVHGKATCQAGSCVGTFACTEQGIRFAIGAGGGPHTFDCDGATEVKTLHDIHIYNDVILNGEGNFTVDGTRRVFFVDEGVTAELDGFVVVGGVATGSELGGGIYNAGGTLTLTNTTVSGGVALKGGGIYNNGTLTLTNTTVSGGIANSGGGICNEGGTLTLTNSTVSGNATEGGCGRGICGAGGIWNAGGTLMMTNSTVSGNTRGGVWHFDLGDPNATATIVSSTVSGNTDDNIVNQVTAGGALTFTNSLVEGGCTIVGDDAATTNGYNIESPFDSCGFDADGTDQVNVPDPMLGPLQDNSGPTWTHALLPGSPAIDQIPEAACEVTTDQRGLPRPVAILGPEPKCDVGAFEVQP